jgi:hypothetical protein
MTRKRRTSQAPRLPQQPKRRPGKQVTFDPAIAEVICRRMAEGESLRSICRGPGMLPPSTVRWWHVSDYHGFAAQYARAREAQADAWASEIVDRARAVPADAAHVAKARLEIDSVKWVASKLLPRRYGERVSAELTGAVGGRSRPSSSSPS